MTSRVAPAMIRASHPGWPGRAAPARPPIGAVTPTRRRWPAGPTRPHRGTDVSTTTTNEEQSLGELVSVATRDLSLLIHKEIELAKSEIAAEVKRAGIGAGLLGGAGFIGFFAML